MAKVKAAATPKTEVLMIPIHTILPDHSQPRQSFNEEEDIELARSVARDGILQPILVRPISSTGPSRYKVVFGHRRLWAAKYNKMASIPSQVKEMTDEEALHIQVIENLQRKNINPMEESDAFSRLVNKKIAKAEQLADELGVSTKYVYDRLALQNAIDPVKDMIRKGKLTISHGKQFARMKKEDQLKLWDNWADEISNEELSLADLKAAIRNSFTLFLSDAIFSTSDTSLIPKAGSCEKCPKRSGCNLLLFDDIQQDDMCFDRDCFDKKTTAHLEKLITDLEKEGHKVVKLSFGYGSNVPADTLPYSQWDEAEEGNHHAMGVIVHTASYTNYKLGNVVPVRLTELASEEVDEEESEACESKTAREESSNSGSATSSKGWVDHNENMQKRVISAIVNSYNNDPLFEKVAADIDRHLRKSLSRYIGSMEDETALQVAEELGVDLTEEQRKVWGSWKIAEYVAGEILSSNLKTAILLAELINDAEVHYDAEELNGVEESVSRIGVSAKQIVEAYCQETGYQIRD